MSDSNAESQSSSEMKRSRFNEHREDHGLSCHRLRTVYHMKGVRGVTDTTQDPSAAADSISGHAFDSLRTISKREKAPAIIISALDDAPLRVAMNVDGYPCHMLRLLDSRFALNRTVSRIAVQTQLSLMSFKGQDTASNIEQYMFLFSQL